jgi:hypothetical protein
VGIAVAPDDILNHYDSRPRAAPRANGLPRQGEAKELIALVRRRKDDIADAFYDIGEALAKLKSREMIVALGLRSFAEVCETKLSMSASFAEQLIDVARSMSRQEAIAMGQSRAIALVGVAQATPQGDTPGEIFRAGRIALPGRASVDVRKASVREITRAATT